MKFQFIPPFRSPRSRWFRHPAALLALAGLPLVSPVAQAANYYWDPGQSNADPGSGGTGAWNTTSTFWKLTGTNGDVVWPNMTANTADFAGTAGTVTLGSAITTGGLIFDTASYNLNTSTFALSLGTSGITSNITSGTTTVSGAITSLGSQSWTVAAGGTLSMGATYSSAAATAYSLTITGAGAVNITGGTSGAPNVVTGVFIAGGGSTVGISGYFNTTSSTLANTKFTVNGGSTVNWSGTGTQSGIYNGVADGSAGTLNVTAGSFTSSPTTSTFIGNGAAGLLSISGGLVTIGTNTAIYLGDGYNGGGNTGTGTITISGGQFTTGTTTGSFVLGSSTLAGTGVINLNGGTFSSNRVFTGTANKATINFNGGTLQANGTVLAIPTSITTNIADNGGTIDSQTFAVTLATNFAHGGTAATDGGLTLTSSSTGTKGAITLTGTLGQTGGLTVNTSAAISGNNTYTGLTAVNAFLDVRTSGNVFGATGAGNGTSVNTGGTVRFRDTANVTIPEAFTFNGGTFLTYNDPGTTTLSGAIKLNANTTLTVSPEAQSSTTLVLSGGIADGTTTGNNLALSRSDAAAAASNDVISITGASTYKGTTTITDGITNTGVFSVQLSGGDNRLPVTTAVTLNTSQLILGNSTAASNQTLTGLTAGNASTINAVIGGNAAASTLTLNIATGTTNTYAGKLGISGATGNQNNLAVATSGPGNLVLTGANAYAGGTTISAGTLTTGSTTALGAGSATVNTGGTLNIGDTAGTPAIGALTLSANANLTLNSGGTLTMTLANNGSKDAITLSGTGVLTLAGALALNTTDSINYGTTYQLFSGAASLNQTGLTITGYDTADYAASLDGTGLLSFSAVTAVPEPATYLGGFILLAAAGWRARSRFAQRVA